MSKTAFTLFEVLISLILFAIVLTTLSKIFIQNDDIEVYYELQNIENTYRETKTIQNSENIKFKYN